MGKGNLEIMMEDFIKVILLMGNFMEKDKHAISDIFMKGNGKMVKWMEQEKVNGLTVNKIYKHNTLVNTNRG
jgi:hypothetical protein